MTITKLNLPTTPHVCAQADCIYMIEGGGVCDDPRINRGNGDAVCHRTPPREILTWLRPLERRS